MLDLHTREGGVENLSNDLVNEARRTWQPRLTPNPGYFLSARRQSECHDLKRGGVFSCLPPPPVVLSVEQMGESSLEGMVEQ
jgi:hypothetical protein